jgi:acyl-CoA hydrolase
MASTAALSFSKRAGDQNIDFTASASCCGRRKISNHEVGAPPGNVIAMNCHDRADIYGNVNSTHIMGSVS